MWVRVDRNYMLDPTFYNIGWMFRCNDIDGANIIMLANRSPNIGTVMRRVRKLIREFKLPVKKLGGVYYDEGIFRMEGGSGWGGLQKSAVVSVESWIDESIDSTLFVEHTCSAWSEELDETIIAENYRHGR